LNVYAEVLLYPLESLVKMLKIKTIICNNDWVIRTYIEEKSTSVKEKKMMKTIPTSAITVGGNNN